MSNENGSNFSPESPSTNQGFEGRVKAVLPANDSFLEGSIKANLRERPETPKPPAVAKPQGTPLPTNPPPQPLPMPNPPSNSVPAQVPQAQAEPKG